MPNITWTPVVEYKFSINGAAYGGAAGSEKFVAFGNNGGKIVYSNSVE